MSDINEQIKKYEENLKLHYEAKRKELEILLTSSIRDQLANMKTILWINFLMIGLMLQYTNTIPLPKIIIGFFILSLCALFCILIAMLFNRIKSYGVAEDLEHINKYDMSDNWVNFRITKDFMYALQESIEDNRRIIINRSKLMYVATWFTFVSLLFIVVAFILKQNL